MIFKADISADRLSRALTKFPNLTRRNIGKTLKTHATDLQGRSRSKIKSRTGNASRSIDFRVDEARLLAVMGFDMAISPVAQYIHEGTREHGPHRTKGPPIRAKNKKVLRWVDKKTGKFRYAKYIKNPKGMRPNPFMVKSAEEHKPLFHKRIGNAVSISAKGAFV